MSDSAEVINFTALERELQSAVEADKKYQRENDAKFRAVQQNVGTYEEFRDIVLASHLKPLDRKDKAGAPRKQPWNALASNNKGQNQTSCDYIKYKEGMLLDAKPVETVYTHGNVRSDTPAIFQPLVSEFQPRTASEFSRDWRRFGSENPKKKYGLLLSLGGECLWGIFKAEVGFGLLGEFLVVLSKGLQPGDESSITDILEGLSKTPRFGLNMSLLSPEERGACRELLHNLRKAAVGKFGVRVQSGDGVVVNGSHLKKIEETHNPEAEAQSLEQGQASEVETLNRLMLLYGGQTVSPP